MAVRKLKPVTPGQRHKIIGAFDTITASTPEKSLLEPIRKTGGRNNQGRMTMRYIGGGHKRKYRIIDFKRDKDGIAAVVDSIQYDPNRTARIALLQYEDGEKRYIVAPNGLQVGQTIKSGSGIDPEIGNTLPLAEIPLGTLVHNIELHPGQGGVMARSAGAYAQLTSRDGKFAILNVGNTEHNLEKSGKAGRSRWLGRRPRVRGVVMNPVDHPMGGGEGRASGGHPRSRKGLLAKGFKTRSLKKASNRYIVERRKK